MTGYTAGFLRMTASGRWAGVLKYKDGCGQWRQVTKAFSADRAESEAAMAAWRAAMAAPGAGGGAGSGGGPSVEDAVRSCLAAQLARGRIERSTHDAQLACAERHLFGELGAVPLASLTPAAAQEWSDALCLGTSPSEARRALSVLRKSCSRAARAGLLEGDPLAGVEAPPAPRPSRAYLPPAS